MQVRSAIPEWEEEEEEEDETEWIADHVFPTARVKCLPDSHKRLIDRPQRDHAKDIGKAAAEQGREGNASDGQAIHAQVDNDAVTRVGFLEELIRETIRRKGNRGTCT